MKKISFVFVLQLSTIFGMPMLGFSMNCGTLEPSQPQRVNIEFFLMSDDIPSAVLERFFESFIYDEKGCFRGAYIGEIEHYASIHEIIAIVKNTGVALAGTVIYEGYKPKLRGCKKNDKWICTLEGDVVSF